MMEAHHFLFWLPFFLRPREKLEVKLLPLTDDRALPSSGHTVALFWNVHSELASELVFLPSNCGRGVGPCTDFRVLRIG